MNHDMMVPEMAVSQSLTSIMEEMVTKVMEDAVSTSIIFTQAPINEEHKVIGNIVIDQVFLHVCSVAGVQRG